MFCPLCLAEFRDGLTQCSDCHVMLVPTLAEASSSRVRRWKGNRQTNLDRIMAELDSAEGPCYYKELVNTKPVFPLWALRLARTLRPLNMKCGYFAGTSIALVWLRV
jgi:hypothetical protein